MVPNDSNVALEIRGITKEYHMSSGPFLALDDVCFDVLKGETIGIIGPNGAGKSTLLKILGRITKPTRGQVHVFGSIASILDIGTGFVPDLSGRDNVFLKGELLGMSRKDISIKFDEIHSFSGIGEFIDSPVKHYSNGMFLRLAFSTLIHLNSDILLFDEVFGVGDEAFRKKCFQLMISGFMSSKTMIIVSHDLHAIKDIIDRVVLIEGGRVQQIGSPTDVLTEYRRKNHVLEGLMNLKNSFVANLSCQLNELQANQVGRFDYREPISVKVYLKLNPNTFLDEFSFALLVTESLDIPIIANGYPNLDSEIVNGCWFSLVIPAKLFNQGSYFIDFLLFQNNKLVYQKNRIGSFDIQNSDQVNNTMNISGETFQTPIFNPNAITKVRG